MMNRDEILDTHLRLAAEQLLVLVEHLAHDAAARPHVHRRGVVTARAFPNQKAAG